MGVKIGDLAPVLNEKIKPVYYEVWMNFEDVKSLYIFIQKMILGVAPNRHAVHAMGRKI